MWGTGWGMPRLQQLQRCAAGLLLLQPGAHNRLFCPSWKVRGREAVREQCTREQRRKHMRWPLDHTICVCASGLFGRPVPATEHSDSPTKLRAPPPRLLAAISWLACAAGGVGMSPQDWRYVQTRLLAALLAGVLPVLQAYVGSKPCGGM